MPYRVENVMRKGEIACYKQFLLFSQSYIVENIVRKGEIACSSNFSFSHNVFHSYISLVLQNVALYGNGLRMFGEC